ncbi:MAG TPA: TonB-dependent receptor [Prolixibacteraceae bacterium]|nr:TonB-dependent receptor [Prolixibacteraceae bacterium]
MKRYFFNFLMLITSIFAKGQIDTTAVYSIQEVVITTQRKPQETITVPYSISYLNRKSLDSFIPRTTPEALANMNGLFVQKTNHGGGSPFIRGLTGNQTLLLIDGIRLNNSIYRYGPNQYLNTIDVFSIDQIEAAKGTGSVQYGTDAIGGALQVFTKSPELNQEKSTFKGSVLGKYMTGDMEKTGHSELEFSSKKYAALVGATYHNFGDIIGGKNTGKQSPSGYNEYAFNTKIIATLGENIQLTFANQFNRQQHVPVYHKVVLENYLLNEFNPQQRMLTYVRMNVQGQGKLFNQLRFIASWQRNMEGRISQKNGSNQMIRERDQVNTLGLTFDFDSKLSSVWTANSGIEIYHDQVGSSRTELNTSDSGLTVNKRGLYPDHSQYGNYSIFTLHHFDFGKWIFDGGVRFNSFSINITDNTLGKVKISPEALVFNSALIYNISREHHIYSAFSSGFRAPNIDDLGTLGIVDFRYEVPAYNLKPEKSQNYELGYKLSLAKLSGTVAAYYMNLNQLITRTKEEGRFIDGYQVYKKENVEEAYIRGFESSFNWKALARLEINGGISYTYGQNMTKNEPLRRIPPLNGRLAGTCKFRNIFYSAEFLFASKQDRLAQGDMSDNRIPQGGTPGWQVVNLYAGYQIASVKLNLGLQNILNEDYRTHGSGINNVGRSAFISAGFSF